MAGKRRPPRRTDFSRERVPIGHTRLRNFRGARGNRQVRVIKVRADGPPQRRWMNYARWLWEAHHGPVPAGMRVAHQDGDLLNDSLGNLVLCTAADVVYLAHANDPDMSRRNYVKLRKATARHNRERGIVNRAMNWLPTQWYAVLPDAGQIWNEPRRKRTQVLRMCGVMDNWRTARSAAIGWGGRLLMESCVLHCLRAGALTFPELREAITALRTMCGWQAGTDSAIRSALSPLSGDGLVKGGRQHGGRYWSTDRAVLERTRKSPVFVVRGRAMIDGAFANFEKVDHPTGVCVRCGCTDGDPCLDALRGACWWEQVGLCSHCAPIGS